MNEAKDTTSGSATDQFYVVDQGEKQLTIDASIDGIDLANTISKLDSDFVREAEEMIAPPRFNGDFEAQQRYVAEMARVAGAREGLKKVFDTFVNIESSPEHPTSHND